MFDLWDCKADKVYKGDNLREVTPILKKTRIDENGFTHYVFSKTIFHNPKFIIPDNDYELFKRFLDGGSREYPSDGNVPADVAANEANIILEKICEIASKSNHQVCKIARDELRKNGKLGLIRGTLKLYLGQYTTRDWRRKRFTDDIDFWIFHKGLLEYVLRECGWKKNTKTKEYEKVIIWFNFNTKKMEKTLLIASNDTNQVLDFGLGGYLEGSTLRDIFKKKLRRGHNVDLSDIINVAIVNNREGDDYFDKDWVDAWNAFEESANIRGMRSTSNLISLCRYSFGIADYLERVSMAIDKYKNTVLNKSEYSDKKIIRVCENSSHFLSNHLKLEPISTRNRIYHNLTKQKIRKLEYANNLRNFANKVLELLNTKFKQAKIIFEVENN
ncbi:MAG: hypothetical protein ACTSRI_06290 [Promethearchaeota archaeon]